MLGLKLIQVDKRGHWNFYSEDTFINTNYKELKCHTIKFISYMAVIIITQSLIELSNNLIRRLLLMLEKHFIKKKHFINLYSFEI